jgi:hypothetical protein
MDFAALIPPWLDAILITPFRWPASPLWGMWLGSLPLAFFCVFLGEYTGAALFLLRRRRRDSAQSEMFRYHNLSVRALHEGNKEVYLAANKLAQENFGKAFFAQAAIGAASLWPLPFALGWMALRFEGIALYRIPGTGRNVGYVFILLTLYILLRLLFSHCKRHLPLLGRVEEMKRRDREERGPIRSFFAEPRRPA